MIGMEVDKMKKIFAVLILIATLAVTIPGVARASGTFALVSAIPETYQVSGQLRRVFTANFIGDASTGAIPDLVITTDGFYPTRGMYLLCTETLGGATLPTSGWAFTVKDDMGVDLLTGNGTSQSVSATVGVATMPSKWIPVSSALTVSVSGNSVPSAGGKLRLTFTSN
jgi:hypothetical protein